MFVDPGKGPVIANYGLEKNLRFIEPVWLLVDTIQVGLYRLNVKLRKAKRPDEKQGQQGVVVWSVEIILKPNTDEMRALLRHHGRL